MEKPTLKRLIDKIDLNKKECWNWTGSKDKAGYGRLYDNNKKEVVLAHRFIFSLYINQPIPDGLQICHKCDNPSCVNPYHLFMGDQRANMQDMIQKNRHNRPVGEKNHKAKLTEAQVLTIRAEYIPMVTTCADLGRKYGITRESIHAILIRKTWKHI